MMVGFFEFGDVDTNFWTFVGSGCIILLGFVLKYIYKNPKDISHDLLVTQVFFDILGFPLIKKLTSVFSCTSTLIWEEDEGVAKRFCKLPRDDLNAMVECMDNDPSTKCWGAQHLTYVVAVMILLVPYYLATLHLQLDALKRQSVIAIDGMWAVVASQTKFFLAVVASSYGDCHPLMCATSSCTLTHSHFHGCSPNQLCGAQTRASNGRGRNDSAPPSANRRRV